MDVHQVAAFFHVGTDTIRNWVKSGQFPAGQQHGGKETWTGADIAAYIHLRGRYSQIDEKEVPKTGQKQPKTEGI